MHTHNRKSSFKTPPITDSEDSQHARRTRALEEQKRKRSQRIDSSRNLDNLAGLSLGNDPEEEPEILREGVAHLASLLPSSNGAPEVLIEAHHSPAGNLRKPRKPNAHFANKIMYAELLEMKDDELLLVTKEDGTDAASDGIPVDLDTNWIALAPVPRGKRCMAVSNQSSGIPGTVTNTFLKSRLKGRTILTFPSPLPPSTVLDCILDDNWKLNGLLHVLDIVRWKGQEVGDCETNFRFWWRDTRLSELMTLPSPYHTIDDSGKSALPSTVGTAVPQVFSYPTVFLPVPYHLNLSYNALLSIIIPLCRSLRHFAIQLPSCANKHRLRDRVDGMDVDQQAIMTPETVTAEIQPDGLLLYVSQASYEPGTSPLSSWVPITSYTEGHESPLDLFERLVMRRASSSPETQAPNIHIELEMEP